MITAVQNKQHAFERIQSHQIDFLKHIQAELHYVSKITEDLSLEQLLTDETKRRAVAQSLLMIGKAFEKVSAEFRTNYTECSWRNFPELCDQLIHRYWAINQTLFWEAITVDVPIDKEWIDVVIEQELAKPSGE